MTAALTLKAKLGRQLESLEQATGPVDARELIAWLQDAMSDLDGWLADGPDQAGRAAEASLGGTATGIFDLARFIKMARAEIAEIRPQDISQEHVQTATDELDAIVESTELATNTIFEAVESIEALSAKMEAVVAEEITNHVTSVYEACSFQDITGQRITKVIKALKQIEDKVDALVDLIGADHDTNFGARQDRRETEKSETRSRPDEHLLNGPQLGEDAIDQSDVDALMGFD